MHALYQNTQHAKAGAVLAWRARGSNAVEVLLLAAEKRPAGGGMGTMLAEALFAKHAPAPARVLLFASDKAKRYWSGVWGLEEHAKGTALPAGAQGMFDPCACTLMVGQPKRKAATGT